ncbi:PREDICTED: uncharacterized protein LOC109171563 [Ipomoea nil]|uniref:uncharacterized protein LOC109171563 n=1 Tax=Ipomoea nil TaxID=35883 RepID=UPI00090192EC|nr:PREDICTED: uncharacterized protein LOC109171563 [Ipomoea nil]
MTKVANAKQRDFEFAEGDNVLLKFRSHRQSSVQRRISQKLAPRYFGPFTIVRKLSTVSYKLALPATAKVHPIFHVSQLRSVAGMYPVLLSFPGISIDEQGYIPQDVLAIHEQSGNTQVLVQWEGQPKDDTTWVDIADFRGQFPNSNLVDKVVSLACSINKERNQWIVYTRKWLSKPNWFTRWTARLERQLTAKSTQHRGI